MTITKDKFAAFNYVLKDENEVELDSSANTEPLGYVHGRGYLIPGLEAQLEGKAPGDKFSCTIQPKDGYGERDERLVAELPKDRFETDDQIEVGMQFQVMTPAGPTIVTVIEVNFDIEVVEVRDTTEEELAQLESGCGGCGGGGCGGCGGGECGNDCENDCGGEGCGNCKN